MAKFIKYAHPCDDGLPPCDIEDDFFPYRGFAGRHSECHVRVWAGDRSVAVVILTELPDNPGTSITDMGLRLWALVELEFARELAGIKTIHRIEHNPPATPLSNHAYKDVDAERPGRERWLPVPAAKVRALIESTREVSNAQV